MIEVQIVLFYDNLVGGFPYKGKKLVCIFSI